MNSGSHKLLSVCVLLMAVVSPSAAQTFEDFFNDNILQEIRFDIRPADWEQLKLHYLENTYYPADMHWKFQGKDMVTCGTCHNGHEMPPEGGKDLEKVKAEAAAKQKK